MVQALIFFVRRWFRPVGAAGLLLACSGTGWAQYTPAFDSAYRVAEALPDSRARLEGLRRLAESSYERTPFQTISFGKVLLRAATEVASDTDQYLAHIVLCTGYERNREYEQAINHGLQAAGIARQRADALRETRALQGIAFTYGSLGLMTGAPADKAQAIRYAMDAMRVASKPGARAEAGYAQTTVADVYAMFSQFDTAVALYERAIAAHRAQGQAVPVATYMNLGNTLYYKQDFQGSLAAYGTADSLNKKRGNSAFYTVKVASNRAILYNDLGQPEESRLQALQVLDDARQMGATDVAVDMLSHLRKLYQKAGRYAEALTFADSLAAVKDRMLSAEKTSQLAELQARYDAGVKDQQIAGQQAVIRQNRQQNLALWGGIALLLAAGGIAFAGLRRSRRLNREIVSHQQALESQKAELERVNAMKDRLFGLVSHDVRVPLNALSAYAELLDHQGDLPPEKIQQYNADLRQTLGDTTVLMENLLQFARTQMQTPQPHPVRFSMGAVLDRVRRLLQPAMDQKGLRLHVDGDSQVPVFADEDMVELILRNVLSNAIKFSKPGGRIAVAVGRDASEYVRVSVDDEGVGMTPEMMDLWNDAGSPRPMQSKRGTQRETGAGLGMLLCKAFTHIIGGQLRASSREGDGTTFTLLVPIGSPAG